MSEDRAPRYTGVQYGPLTLPVPPEGEMLVEAVCLIKVIRSDGKVTYREYKSPGLHQVEALGMATTFADTMRHQLMAGVPGGAE